MTIKWKNKKNLRPEIILDKIKDNCHLAIDGSVSFSALDYNNLIGSLYSMIEFPRNSIPLNNMNLLSRAITNAAKSKQINKDYVLSEIQKIAKIETSKKESKYNIITSISMNYELPSQVLKVGKSTIKFIRDLPRELLKIRNENLNSFKLNQEIMHANYMNVIIEIKAKGEIEAINKALDDLDLLRAIFCLYSNSDMVLFSNNTPKPINKIRLGQFHTIHNESGELVEPRKYWYEPNFLLNEIFTPNKDLNEYFNQELENILFNLEQCKYSDKLKNALLRYVRSFDEKNNHISLLEVWGALESLTAANDSNKDKLPKRCAFLYKEYELHKQILENLREYRNQSVHDGIRNEYVRNYCYQVQSYFRQLIFFHLAEYREFNCIEDANEFLDQSVDINELVKKKKLIEKAIEFLEPIEIRDEVVASS